MSVNLNNSTTLTISGSASNYVVIAVTDSSPSFNGKIVLTGGITSDQVIFNMFGGNYTTHTGGPTLTISTNGQTTAGTFLDPNGSMQINNSVLNGRFFGGDVQDQQIVSGASINAPAPIPGDYNNNGTVDAADYLLWRKGGPLANEVDTPGTVNGADYTAWRSRFGNPAGGGASANTNAAVPEPATLVLLMITAGAWCLCQRRSA